MTITLDLSPDEAAVWQEQAAQAGVPVGEWIHRHLPTPKVADTPEAKPDTTPKIDHETLALLQSWLDEGANATPEQRERDEEELEEFMAAINRNRAEVGALPVY